MTKLIATTAFAALLAIGLTTATQASEARDAFNAALDKCEDLERDQRQDCYNQAMEEYRMAREKESMNK